MDDPIEEAHGELTKRAANPEGRFPIEGSAAGLARRFEATREAVAWGRRAVEVEHTKPSLAAIALMAPDLPDDVRTLARDVLKDEE